MQQRLGHFGLWDSSGHIRVYALDLRVFMQYIEMHAKHIFMHLKAFRFSRGGCGPHGKAVAADEVRNFVRGLGLPLEGGRGPIDRP